MAEIIWLQPAVEDLDRIADYIALDKPDAAKALVKRAYERVSQLQSHPLSGPVVPELRNSGRAYRQIIEPPLRIYYRVEKDTVYILHVIRGERQFSRRELKSRRIK
jgi:addiction module RelE/StbE family toxin